MNATYKMTLSEVKSACAFWGYSVRVNDGELEAYPKGKRGDASTFESNDPIGRKSLVDTVKASACYTFERAVDNCELLAGLPFAGDALCAWFYDNGAEWKPRLIGAWMTGNYHGSAVSGSLQLLRNHARGFDIVESL